MDVHDPVQRKHLRVGPHDVAFWHRPGTADESIFDEVLASYRLRQLVTTLRQQRHGGTRPLRILDVGAHIGAFSLLAAKHLPSASVEAFEMLADNFALLERNVAANQLEGHVQATHCIVADQAGWWRGTDHRYGTDGNTGGASVATSAFETVESTGAVPVLAASNVLAGAPIDLLKLDCEGSEFRVLFGADDALENVRMMTGELHFADFAGHTTNSLPWTRDSLMEFLAPRFQITTWDQRDMPWGYSQQFLAVQNR